MTCYSALPITTGAWLLFAAVCLYAMHRQAKWMAAQLRKDQTDWEQGFVRSLANRMHAGEVTKLTGDQVDKLDELHGKHFA
ncbi:MULTISPECIES: hypothetical protein [Cupriavidus]|jgi:hypothetical protein|uniref:hypothetical protein n=1 Tax=Cupriavidus TaxID=106589 RepID=UPI000579238B|nr:MULTISPECIES: hypothetical protein [Cupriavidus]KWR80327.1 hypothetical protein RN01_19015 [Cupriavidus sp. SHE]QWC90347.1 hypothetical protein KB891_11810 [Cupriavidus metallidurans]